MKRLFSKDDLTKIESHIKKFEEFTTGQIVVVTALKSDPYTSIPLRLGLFGIVVSSLFILYSKTYYWTPLPYLFIFQLIAFILFSLLGKTSYAIRFCVPQWFLEMRVRKSAMASFVEKGAHQTKNNTGILIYLSEWEHRVEIIADTSAFQALGLDTLQNQATSIIAGIKANLATDATCRTIDDLAILLQKHFPKTENNLNELSNEVRVE